MFETYCTKLLFFVINKKIKNIYIFKSNLSLRPAKEQSGQPPGNGEGAELHRHLVAKSNVSSQAGESQKICGRAGGI